MDATCRPRASPGDNPALNVTTDLIERLDRILPQTQCGQCGYAGCRPYAEAMARGDADIDRCPPGGDAGELGTRQIFAGIRGSYGEPEKLVGRNVVFIANLAPRKMRFGMSEGMILSAGFDGGGLHLLDADVGALPGMPVK